MSTEDVVSEIRAFYEFLGQRTDDPAITPERSVLEFRAYQQELQRAQEELRVSHEEFRQGQAKPLDVDALIQRVQARVARHGSTP